MLYWSPKIKCCCCGKQIRIQNNRHICFIENCATLFYGNTWFRFFPLIKIEILGKSLPYFSLFTQFTLTIVKYLGISLSYDNIKMLSMLIDYFKQ